jgi:hypothetical protein
VQLDQLPENVRGYVEQVLGLARMQHAGQENAQQALKQSKDYFDQLVQQLEDAGVTDAAPLAERIAAQDATLTVYAQQAAQSAWVAFEARNPYYQTLPPATRELFAQLLERNGFEDVWEGRNYVEKLEDAMKFALYRTGVQVAPATATPSSSARMLPPVSTQPRDNGVARRQAAVASGESGGGLPVRAIDELSWDEVLGRHDHLLRK